MIVKMKKLTLLVSQKDREILLKKIRSLGVIHIKNISVPTGYDLNLVGDTLENTKNAISILERYKKFAESGKIGWDIQTLPDKAREVNEAFEEREDIIKELNDLKNQIEDFKPWGSFDPHDIKALHEKGIYVRLYRATKKELKNIKEKEKIHIIREDKKYIYLAHISQDKDERLPFEEIKIPKESFVSLCKRCESFNKDIEKIDNMLRYSARAIDSLKENLAKLQSKYTFLNVMHGMKDEDKFLYLQGFSPVNRVKEIIALSKSEGFGYLVEDPDDPTETPTLIRNPKWISIIMPVFKFMNTIPGYNEYDISFWFLTFFSVFFAMLIGDAGYGILFIAITFFAKIKLKKAPKEPFRLMYVLSLATIIWGAISGTYFGAKEIAQIPFLNSLIIDNIDSFAADNQNFMIYLCFVIGVIHLTLAHFTIFFKIINSTKALSELGWISILWGLFFAAGTLVLGKTFPLFAFYLLLGGALFVLLFSNPQKNLLKGIFMTLVNLPLKIISSFSDVVSYLRLFAVGYATLILAKTFNDMAIDLGFNSITTSLGAAFILFFGHALNIILGLMAIIVHGIRLNMLEFSGQMGIEWSGKEYDPFREEGIAV